MRYSALNNGVTLKSGYWVVQGHCKWHHSKAWYGFLFTFHSNYGSVLLHFISRISEISVESRYFFIPPLFNAPLRGSPSEYRHKASYAKTRMAWLRDGEKSLRIRLFVLTEFTNVTDGQTDRQSVLTLSDYGHLL